MKGVILAAGSGTRLRPITYSKPKCMVKVAGKPIISYQLEAFRGAGIREIVIICGHKGGAVRDYCKTIKGLKIVFIENKAYKSTNNMYSLYLARQRLTGKPFILINGDIVLKPSVMRKMVKERCDDIIACDRDVYNRESMKITVNGSGNINSIKKNVKKVSAYATSIDLYRFSGHSSRVFFNEIEKTISRRLLKEWTEVALNKLLCEENLKMSPLDISGEPWAEIDNYDDLAEADKTFSRFDRTFRKKKVVFIDLDGTVYIGDRLIKGAKEFVGYLRRKGVRYFFLSNNSSRSKKDYVKKLRRLGIDAREGNIILSTDGVIEFLRKERVKDVFMVGTRSMGRMFKKAGIRTSSNRPRYVVLGYDTDITYKKIKKAALLMRNGIRLIATHRDVNCPTPSGPVPDIGSMLSMFEISTGKRAFKIFGKPSPLMVKHAITRCKASPKQAVVIGDRLYTDNVLAERIGCDFICVLSGEAGRGDIEDLPRQPVMIAKNLGSIID
jgi:HAD superfamily hydrolase (TIGR01450 family)